MALSRVWRSLPVANIRRQPWAISPAVAPRLNPLEPLEEEKTPYYHADRFYPVELGDILKGRYQVATKLGYGCSSTVWLARDLHRYRWESERYVAIKISSVRKSISENGAQPELAMLKRILETNTQHKGWHFVRKLIDSFTVGGPSHQHICLVFEPMREPLWVYSQRFVDNVIPPDVLKIILRMTLLGLDYLHRECQIIHTDLKPDNIMVKIEDPHILARDDEDEYRNPLPQKHTDGRIIYMSRNNFGIPSVPTGVIEIVDLDLSVLGNAPRTGCIQAEIYRAPEVILDAGYTYAADIWSLGVMLWDLLEGHKLFNYANQEHSDGYDEHLHLAQITALLGPRPKELAHGKRTSIFYNTDGHLRKPTTVPPDFGFESTLRQVEGDEKRTFIKFIKRMLKWCPEDRSTAKELFDDPWLHTDFP